MNTITIPINDYVTPPIREDKIRKAVDFITQGTYRYYILWVGCPDRNSWDDNHALHNFTPNEIREVARLFLVARWTVATCSYYESGYNMPICISKLPPEELRTVLAHYKVSRVLNCWGIAQMDADEVNKTIRY